MLKLYGSDLNIAVLYQQICDGRSFFYLAELLFFGCVRDLCFFLIFVESVGRVDYVTDFRRRTSRLRSH